MKQNTKRPWGLIFGLAAVLLVIILIVGNFLLGKDKLTTPQMTLYWGNTCTYCHQLMNGKIYKEVTSKYQLTLRETFLNANHNLELMQNANKCGLAADDVGVPMLYLNEYERCFIGPPMIEEFFTALLAGENPDQILRADGDAYVGATLSGELNEINLTVANE